MKALRVTGSDVEPMIMEIEGPLPDSDEVVIEVEACALNFADLLMARGDYQEQPAFPLTPGLEVAGSIVRVGAGVDSRFVGRRVAAFTGKGGLAEEVCVNFSRCVMLPDQVSYTDAAAVQVAYGTSHLALERTARLQAGETLIVTGAAGGVGLTAIELGKQMGARVIGAARGADKCDIVRKAGADHVFDSDGDEMIEAIKHLGGADVVYDAVGGKGFRDLVRITRPEGRILLIGFASGTLPEIRPNHLLVKNISVHGFYWGGFLDFNAKALTGSLEQIFGWLNAGRIKPHISQEFPLERAAEAMEMLRNRTATGKIVVTR